MTEPTPTPPAAVDDDDLSGAPFDFSEGADQPIADSAFDGVRKKRAELQAAQTYDLEVSGYGGDLMIRFKPLQWAELTRVINALNDAKNPAQELKVQASFLHRAAASVHVKVGDELVDTGHELDQFIAQKLGIEAEKAVDIVKGVFGRDNGRNMAPLADAAGEVLNWMRGKSQEVDKELLGE